MKYLQKIVLLLGLLHTLTCFAGDYSEDQTNLKTIQSQPFSVLPHANSNAEEVLNNTFGDYLKKVPPTKKKVTLEGLAYVFKLLSKYKYVPKDNPCELDTPAETGFLSHLKKISVRNSLKNSCKPATLDCVNENLIQKISQCTTIHPQVLRELFQITLDKTADAESCTKTTASGVIHESGENCLKTIATAAKTAAVESKETPKQTTQPEKVLPKKPLQRGATIAAVTPGTSKKTLRKAHSINVPSQFDEIPVGTVNLRSTAIKRSIRKEAHSGQLQIKTLADLKPYTESTRALRETFGLPENIVEYNPISQKERNLTKGAPQKAKDDHLSLDLFSLYDSAEREIILKSYQTNLNEFIKNRISDPSQITEKLKREILLTSFLFHTYQLNRNLKHGEGTFQANKNEFEYTGGFKHFLFKVILNTINKSNKTDKDLSLTEGAKITTTQLQEKLKLYYEQNEESQKTIARVEESNYIPTTTRTFPGVSEERIIYKGFTYKKENAVDSKIKNLFPEKTTGFVITGKSSKPMYDVPQYEVIFKVKKQLAGSDKWEWGYIQIPDMKEDRLKLLNELSQDKKMSFVIPYDMPNAFKPTLLGVPVEDSPEKPYTFYIFATPHNSAVPKPFYETTLKVRKAYEKEKIDPVKIDQR